jgi:hypothetical protein
MESLRALRSRLDKNTATTGQQRGCTITMAIRKSHERDAMNSSQYIYATTKYYASNPTKINVPSKTPKSNSPIYSFAMPVFRLSYLLYGYSRQFSLFSICLPS